MTEDILLQINKPARYIGGEWNVAKKDFAQAEIKFALCFPDLYEVGMSNLGLRILYGILNSLEGVVCERFFAVAGDLEAVLRNKGLEILSLESRKRLRDFDIIGFSLGYELCYTNALNILELGAIPLEAALRGSDYPLVIGGGPCVLNPEPLHEFFDLFVFGEAEEAISEIIGAYRKLKSKFQAGRLNKQELLAELCAIEGVYAPSLFEVAYSEEGCIKEFRPRSNGIPLKVKKRFVRDLDAAYFPADWLIPFVQIIHDRLTLEVMRGCPNKCRFCQARSQYFPLRYRSKEKIFNLACDSYLRSGYEEISLCGLSVSDYRDLEGLLQGMVRHFKEKAVSISLPSIKPAAMLGDASSLIATIKKTGLTFAPEAGTLRLREVLAKDFNEEEFFRLMEKAYLAGYQHVKLYFMIGLPYEEEKDLEEILNFSLRVSRLRKKINRGAAQVNISVNTLIPKPHTPFQWFAMAGPQEIGRKEGYLRGKLKDRRLKLNIHNREMSFLEGVLSRGDRRLSRVILGAFRNGARFDAWQDSFSLSRWMDAFRQEEINPYFYLEGKSENAILPWDFLDVGISKDLLLSEFKKIIARQ